MLGVMNDTKWVEIAVHSESQREAVLACLRHIHVPGVETAEGFRVIGWVRDGAMVEY